MKNGVASNLRPAFLFAVGLGAALCALPGRGWAQTAYYVTPTGTAANSGTSWATAWSNVQTAVSAATNAGDEIYLRWGVYSNASQVAISNAGGVTIVGGCHGWDGEGSNAYSGTNSTLTRSGAGAMRIVYGINSTAALAGVTVAGGYFFTGGYNGAGLYFTNCAVTLTNCVVSDNTNVNTGTAVGGHGGGLYCVGGSLGVHACVFSNNYLQHTSQKYSGGAALAASNALVSLAGTLFVANRLYNVTGASFFQGGAVFCGGSETLITNCQFQGNSAYGNDGSSEGGAVYAGGGSAVICNSAFSSNTCYSGGYGPTVRGGGVRLTGLQSADVRSNWFMDNWITGANKYGAALYLGGCATSTVDDCLIESRNKVANAELVCVSGGSNAFILNSTIRSNSGSRGIYFAGGATACLVVSNCNVINNGSDGLWLTGAVAGVINSVMADNSAGGVRWDGPGTLGMTNCLIVNNGSDGFYLAAGTASLVNCTFADNGRWGVARPTSYGLTVKNSIFWGNALGGILNPAAGEITYTDSQDGTPAGSGNFSADPLFVNPAAGDYHLRSTAGSWHGGAWEADARLSPCIDAGDPASEWRQEAKPSGGRVNLGAYGNTAQASHTPRGTVFWAK